MKRPVQWCLVCRKFVEKWSHSSCLNFIGHRRPIFDWLVDKELTQNFLDHFMTPNDFLWLNFTTFSWLLGSSCITVSQIRGVLTTLHSDVMWSVAVVWVKRILTSCESNNSLPAARIVEYSRIMPCMNNHDNFQVFANQSGKISTVKSCIKAAAYVQFFNFLVRLLFKCGFYLVAAYMQSAESAKPVKAVWDM